MVCVPIFPEILKSPPVYSKASSFFEQKFQQPHGFWNFSMTGQNIIGKIFVRGSYLYKDIRQMNISITVCLPRELLLKKMKNYVFLSEVSKTLGLYKKPILLN